MKEHINKRQVAKYFGLCLPTMISIILLLSIASLSFAQAFTAKTIGDYGNVTVMEANGIPAVVEGNTFTATGIVLKDGSNKVTATATNTAGKTTSDTVFITYKVPIMIYITFPYDDAELSVSPIDIEGVVSEPAATVVVNGIIATVSGNGRFIASGISLSEGLNPITANATKSDGHTGSYTITVNYHTATVPPMSLSITSPTSNATINRPSVIVKGTVTTEASEVSIKVNGILADVYGTQFVANNVPLVDGDNVIIANAIDGNGAVARAEITVNAITTGPYITLSANITSGIPPLTTYFSVSTEIPNSVVSYEMDFEGDGIADYTGDTFENVNHTYTTEGIFYPTLTVTDDQGNTFADSMAITVMNKDAIDALLKGKWEGMKGSLSNQNVEGGLGYFLESSKETYRQAFNIIIDELPQIISDMQDIEIIYLKDNVAKYRINRIHNINGTFQTITYYIYFVKDANGVWKVDRF